MYKFLLSFISINFILFSGAAFYFYNTSLSEHSDCNHTEHSHEQLNSPPNNGFCAFDAVQNNLSSQEIQLQNQLEQQLYSILQKGYPITNVKALYTIPVVVHVIHNNGPGNIANTQVTDAIQHLNDAFANVGVYNPATGVDVEVQFCMAQRDPVGDTTNGITNTVSTLTSMNMNTQDLALKNLIRWNPFEYVNIWVVNDIQGGVAGYAYFPSSHGNNNDGIVLEASYMGTTTDNSKVLVHEMGHYLGLYHTFQAGCTNNDCLNDGDKVCDTPPDNTTAHIPCVATSNSCTTDEDDITVNNPFRPVSNGGLGDQNDQIENYMDYSTLSCYDRFTAGQKVRMHFFLTGTRASLLSSMACMPPCSSPIVIGFNASATTVVAGTLVNFTNTTTNGSTYEWFNNGTSFATTTNSSQTFNTPGVYYIVLEATNGDPNCTLRDTIMITVNCAAQAAFTPSSTQVSPNDVVFFTNNSTGATSYEWFVNNVVQGTGTSFNFTFPTIGTYDIFLVATDGSCYDTTSTIIITVTPSGLAQTGLPVWPLAVVGNVNPQTVDWRDTTPIITNITSTTTNGGQTGAAFNECGQLAFYVLHTGSGNANNLFIYAADGTPLLTNTTANAPGLNGVKGGQEIQVVKVPQTLDEWYIIYKQWTTDVGAPASNAAYNPANWLYSRVQYTGGNNLTVISRDIALMDGSGVSHTYTDGAAVSRTAMGVAGQHHLYLSRRTLNVSTISVDRFLIDNTGISFLANTGNITANWWSLTVSGSPIELSPTEDKIAIICRNQNVNYTDIVLFDAVQFNVATAQTISAGDLMLQPDGGASDQSNVLNISGTVDAISLNATYPLGFLRNMERKIGGMEFSPNGRFLYFTGGGYSQSGYTYISYLGQIDLNQNPLELRLQIQIPPAAPNMTSGLGCSFASCGATWNSVGTIESCYDGNLYFAKRNQSTLYVIPDPNNFMPQNLVPSQIDLSTAAEPNININAGQPRAFPDQIDGFNYLSTQYREVELIVQKLDCNNNCDTLPYTLEIIDSSGAVVESFLVSQCPDTITFCADTNLVYALRDTTGLTFPNAIFYGQTLCPNTACVFDFTNNSNCDQFICDGNFYQTIDSSGDIVLYNVTSNPVTFNHISNLTNNGLITSLNSIAYNPLDNFIYGIDQNPPHSLYRINSQGIATYLGNVTGMTGQNHAGCMDASGNYYVTGGSQTLYKIDINTLTSTQIGVTNQSCADIAFNPSDGMLYGFEPTVFRLMRIDPSNAAVTFVGPASTQFVTFGAMYFNAQGDIIAYGNDATITATTQETLVKIDPNTGLITVLGTGPEVGTNDGCSCPYRVEMTKGCASTTQAGSTFTYTFKIYNRTGYVASNVQFNDVLTNGLLWASEPQNLYGVTIGATSISGTNTAQFTIDSVHTGVDSFTIEVTIPCSFADTIYRNMAYLSNLSANLPIPDSAFSDDPNTVELTDTTDIAVLPYVIGNDPDLGPDTTVCENGIVHLNAGSGFSSYLWQNGHIDSSITADEAGLYWVEVISVCGDTLRDSINIAWETAGLITVADTTICLGDTLSLSFNNSLTYQWFPNSSVSCSGCSDPEFVPQTSTTFTAVVNNSIGCYSSDSFTVTVITCVVPVTTYLDTFVCMGDSLSYSGNTLQAGTVDTFQYTTTLGADSFVIVTVNEADTFNITIDTFADAGSSIDFGGQTLSPNSSTLFNFITFMGCDSLITVNVIENSVFMGMPDAFTPNGDGINDLFKPVGISGDDIVRFRLFNRWSQEVYNGDDLQNGGWNGRFMDVEQPQEVYIYLLEYDINGSGSKIMKGEFTLLR